MMMLLMFAMLHPVHETVAEVEWNGETKKLEVALRLDVLDEQWLNRKYSHGEPRSKWALDYLSKCFRVADQPKNDESDSTAYRWIGVDSEGSHVWWYFEIEPLSGESPEWIDVRILQDREDNYTHRILILNHTPPRSLDLSAQRPMARIDEAKHDRISSPSTVR